MDVSDFFITSEPMSQHNISEALRVHEEKAAGGKRSFLNSTSYFDRWGKNGTLKPSVRK